MDIGYGVALLAEGVDRNSTCSSKMLAAMIVALLAEGVDRNSIFRPRLLTSKSRPPRGGRG